MSSSVDYENFIKRLCEQRIALRQEMKATQQVEILPFPCITSNVRLPPSVTKDKIASVVGFLSNKKFLLQ